MKMKPAGPSVRFQEQLLLALVDPLDFFQKIEPGAHLLAERVKRLQVFRPDLVHLKGIVEQTPPGEGTHVALNLRLPSGQLAAKKNASNPTTAIKSAFDELLQQLVRHKDLLRSSHKWRRTKGNAHQDRELGVPFEQTIAAATVKLTSP